VRDQGVGKGIAWAAMCEQVPVVPGGTRVRTLAYLKLACAKQQWGMVHAGCVPGLSPSLPVSGGTHSGIVGSSSASLRRFFCLLSTDGLCTRFKSAHSGQPHFQIVSPLPGNSLFERGEGGEEGGRGGGEEGGRGGGSDRILFCRGPTLAHRFPTALLSFCSSPCLPPRAEPRALSFTPRASEIVSGGRTYRSDDAACTWSSSTSSRRDPLCRRPRRRRSRSRDCTPLGPRLCPSLARPLAPPSVVPPSCAAAARTPLAFS